MIDCDAKFIQITRQQTETIMSQAANCPEGFVCNLLVAKHVTWQLLACQ